MCTGSSFLSGFWILEKTIAFSSQCPSLRDLCWPPAPIISFKRKKYEEWARNGVKSDYGLSFSISMWDLSTVDSWNVGVRDANPLYCWKLGHHFRLPKHLTIASLLLMEALLIIHTADETCFVCSMYYILYAYNKASGRNTMF